MSKMYDFIQEQPEALRRVLNGRFDAALVGSAIRARGIRKVWVTGSGTSLYAAMIVGAYWERVLNIDAEAISSLEFLDVVPTTSPATTAVVGISQSGASFILVEGLRRAREAGCLTIVVTAEVGAIAGEVAEFVMPTFTGPEDAMGKTKGFSTTALAGCLLGRHLADPARDLPDFDDFPAAVARVVEEFGARVGDWAARLTTVDVVFTVGAGDLLPAAWEGGLKILEVAKQVVVTKELEEMLHGPFNAAGPGCGFVLLSGTIDRADRVRAFVDGVAAIGLPLLIVGEAATMAPIADNLARYELPPVKEPALRAILAVVPLQLLAERLARERGLDPDTARYPFLYKILASKTIYI